ncbi:hypothetical protein DR093_03135, partial [Mycoplasma flocculare]|nr:hypothetical protein [Mesomycoplasma flocculare]
PRGRDDRGGDDGAGRRDAQHHHERGRPHDECGDPDDRHRAGERELAVRTGQGPPTHEERGDDGDPLADQQPHTYRSPVLRQREHKDGA